MYKICPETKSNCYFIECVLQKTLLRDMFVFQSLQAIKLFTISVFHILEVLIRVPGWKLKLDNGRINLAAVSLL